VKNGSDQDGKQPPALCRRQFLKLGVVAAAAATLFPITASARMRPPPERALSFYNIHTGEYLKTAYWAQGRYTAGAMEDINYLLRDYRTGQVRAIDPRLLDLLYAVNHRLGSSQPFHVVSGYRSPATNAMLAAASTGVAKHSLHIEGKAIDIYLPNRSLRELHRAALALGRGGVGYYPESNFVHMDVGPVRTW
jgi:uncharacterized protein YcbK (DUF882 family)